MRKNQNQPANKSFESGEEPASDKMKAAGFIADVAQEASRPKEEVVETKQIVTFELDEEEYAVPIADLKEIIRVTDIVTVPGAPAFIRGILNLRGQVVVIVDIEKRFGLSREEEIKPHHIIIIEIEQTIFGIIVDEVTGVMRVPVASIKPPPAMITSKIKADFVRGVIIVSGDTTDTTDGTTNQKEELEEHKGLVEETSRMLLLLNLPKMLAEKELLGFGDEVRRGELARDS